MSDQLKTSELLETERQERIAHATAIGKATIDVEKILIANNFTMDDLSEIVSTLNGRAQKVFSELKISEIKYYFDNH